MKKLVSLAVLLAAAAVYAGTYSVTTNTAQDNRLERQRLRLNRTACRLVNLPDACTQAQCRNLNPQCDIFSDITDLLTRYVVKNYTDSLKQVDTSDDQQQFCAWFAAATVAQRNSACALAGLPNGCEICP